MAEQPPNERVFVSGLPPDLNEEQLNSIFGAYGSLTQVRNLGASRCCVLTFATVEEAKWVVENLDGNMPEGISQPVSVRFGKPEGPGTAAGPPGGAPGMQGGFRGHSGPAGKGRQQFHAGGMSNGGAGKGGGVRDLKRSLEGTLPSFKAARTDANQVYVSGLPPDTTDGDLFEIFTPFGAIPPKGIKALRDAGGTRCKGVGFVDFIEPADALQAVTALDGYVLEDGSYLRVAVKNTTYKGKGKGKGKGGGGGLGGGCAEATAQTLLSGLTQALGLRA